MSLIPDPTFYPSPGMAMKAAPEHVAYVSMLNVAKNGKHDAMGVIDVAPHSSRPQSARSGGPVIGKRVMLTATQEPRMDPRLLAGSRILAGVVIPAFPTALWSPAVAALLSPS